MGERDSVATGANAQTAGTGVAELREVLLRSTRLQEVYGAGSFLLSNFDEEFLLNELARRARELFSALHCDAAALDESGKIKRLIHVAGAGEDPDLTAAPPWIEGLLATLGTLKTPVRWDDLGDQLGGIRFVPGLPTRIALLGVPLIARGETLGVICLTHKSDGLPFTSEDEDLLAILAAAAASALSHARIYDQLRRNIEQLYALHQIGEAIATSLSPEEVLRIFGQDVGRLCGAEASVISEWNSVSNRLVTLSENGSPELLALRDRPHLYRQLIEAARRAQSASFSLNEDRMPGERLYGYVVPLAVRDHVIGLAEMYSNSPNILVGEAATMFVTLSAQLAVGIENSRLYTQLRDREEQLRRFVGRLFQAQEDERRRMSYDIHDGLAQLIVSADMHINNFVSLRGSEAELSERELAKGVNGLRAALTEVRRVVSELRPSTLDDFGLPDTLSRYVEKMAAENHWDFTFRQNLGEMRFDPLIENAVYRILQEALTNVRKHSNATRVAVEICQVDEHLRIQIQDWGSGFDLDAARLMEGHFGLGSMEERARLLGGWCLIESTPGIGTTVKAELPFQPETPVAQARTAANVR